MFYYGFEYLGGLRTTTGEPNKLTKRMSIAGFLHVFKDKKVRDVWISEGRATSAMSGNCRKAISKKEARRLHLGMSLANYDEMINALHANHD